MHVEAWSCGPRWWLRSVQAWYLELEACVLVALMAGFEGDEELASVAKDVEIGSFEGGKVIAAENEPDHRHPAYLP